MPNLTFLAPAVTEIWRGSQNFKSRSRDPFPTPFDLILHFFKKLTHFEIEGGKAPYFQYLNRYNLAANFRFH